MSRRRAEEAILMEARRVAACAYVPFSGFRVGAVLEDLDGKLYAGCNVECASIGLSLCAERAALGLAVSQGALQFTRLLIYTPTARPTWPCGACRELLLELAGDLTVVLASDSSPLIRKRLSRLLPFKRQGKGELA